MEESIMETANQQEHMEEAPIGVVEDTVQAHERKRVEQLEKENAILKQNAAAAAKAPVRGVSAGAVQSNPAASFEKGLFSDPW